MKSRHNNLLPIIVFFALCSCFNVSAQLIENTQDTTVLPSKNEKTVFVDGKSRRNNALNEMSVVSSRAFSVEETRRYAAAVNDPLRMATAFAGVTGTDDGQNNISIRGNSPTGLLWRMEGIDIPNPNHFSSPAGSGGGISILSAQLLSNSDFVTGAFAAEYGNAVGGVFDLKLRKGNNERKKYTAEAGILGLNFAAEGPIAPFYKGSYLVNYRYSTLSLLGKIGMDIGDASTDFQDLAYNISLPTARLGQFTLFGFTGLSSQSDEPEPDETKWESDFDRYSGKFSSNTTMNGITHNADIGKTLNIRSAVSFSATRQRYNENYVEDDKNILNAYRDINTTNKFTFNSTLNYRINNKNLVRSGIIVSALNFRFYQLSRENILTPVEEKINVRGNTQTLQGFSQWQHKLSENISFNAGFHFLHLVLNNSSAIEPRASIKWDPNQKNSLSLGYGLHSQLQGMGVYFTTLAEPEDQSLQPNKQLGFTKSHHIVLSYGRVLNKNLRIKAELYYQRLVNVPISDSDTSTFSTVNIQEGYVTKKLVNNGKGRNYGAEFSLQRYFADNYYFMINASIYQAKYTAADGIERNTAFNGNHVLNFISGKDFLADNNKRTLGINIKTIYSGGLRSTPVDLELSRLNGYSVYNEKEAFSIQNPAYFRTDLRMSVKWNGKKTTPTLSLDLQNVTNRKNIHTRVYDAVTDDYRNLYQMGLIPVLNYRIEF